MDGRTASGKTSFGHELAHALAARGRPVLRASLDDFKRPWRDRGLYDRESGEGYYRNAFDYDAVRRLLLTPMVGDGVCALCSVDPRTQIDHSEATVQAAPDAILVVDGVFAFRPELNDHWDLRIWLEIATADSIARGLARDGGLYVPAEWPQFTHDDLTALAGLTWSDTFISSIPRQARKPSFSSPIHR